MEFFISAFGIKQVRTRFDRIGVAAIDARPAMSAVAEVIYRIEAALFNSQGRRGGGSWRQDTAEWLLRKQRNGLDPRINHASGALRSSMTQRGDTNQILEIQRDSLRFGSRLPYAATTQRHRPIIKFTVYDRAELRAVIRDYLMTAWRAA